MAWIDIGALDADRRDWQLSQPFTGNLIKIVNELSEIPITFNFTGLLGINYGFEDFLEIKQIFSNPTSQLFLFPNVNFDKPKYLAIKNISRTSNMGQWTVRAYVWNKTYIETNTIEEMNTAFNGDRNNHGYLKTANTIEQFSQKPAFDGGEILWVTPSGGNVNGTLGYDADANSRTLTIGTGATNKLITQTKQSFVYLAGNVHKFSTGVISQVPDGGVIDFGMFNDENGAFIRIKGTATGKQLEVVRRSKANGTVTDEIVSQQNFNVDKLDGTGKSGITLDLNKVQMFSIEFSWYGAGGVAFAIDVNRQRIIFHYFSAGNRLDSFIFGTPDLPVRYALYNTKTTTSNTVLKVGGIFVGIDGSFDQRKGFNRGYVRPLRSVSQNQSYVLASIRPSINYKGKINSAYARIEDFFVYGSADGTYSLEFLPTLTSPSWTPVNSVASMMEYDISATNAVNGVVLYCGSIASQSASDKKEVLTSKDPLTAFSDGSGSNHLSIVFNCTTQGNIGCGFNWSEYY